MSEPPSPLDAFAAGERLARLRLTAAPARAPADERAALLATCEALLPLLAGRPSAAADARATQRFADAFLTGWADVFAARLAAGRTLDGRGDSADDLARLLLELDAIAHADSTRAVIDGFVHAGGIAPPQSLLAFFVAHRALDRALDQARGTPAAPVDEIAPLLTLARHSAWRARGPLLVVVAGALDGAPRLAHELGRTAGLPVVSLGQAPSVDGAAVIDAAAADPRFRASRLQEIHIDGRPAHAVDCVDGPVPLRPAASPGDDDGRLTVSCRSPLHVQVDAVEAWLDGRLAQGVLL